MCKQEQQWITAFVSTTGKKKSLLKLDLEVINQTDLVTLPLLPKRILSETV